MTFYKTTAAFGATACLLMASTAFGINVTNTFESVTDGWVGDCALDTLATAYTAPTPAGLPTGGTTDSKVLAVSGSATNAYNASGNHFVDMMVKVSIPDEELGELGTGTGGDAEGAKFAVAVDSNGVFKCYTPSANPVWTPLSSTPYAADAWVRVTMKFDYTGGTCTVALDGNTCGTFPLISSASALASVEVKGSTAIDEVVVAQGSLPAFADQTAVVAENCLATKAWLTKNDVTWPTSPSADQIAALSSQYVFGLAPDTTATTAATLPLSFEQDDDDDKATLSFPGFGAYGGTGTYVLQSSATGAANSFSDVVPAATITSGAAGSKTTVSLPSTPGQAVYYRIKAQAAQSGS